MTGTYKQEQKRGVTRLDVEAKEQKQIQMKQKVEEADKNARLSRVQKRQNTHTKTQNEADPFRTRRTPPNGSSQTR
jgi:hypothetical protein